MQFRFNLQARCRCNLNLGIEKFLEIEDLIRKGWLNIEFKPETGHSHTRRHDRLPRDCFVRASFKTRVLRASFKSRVLARFSLIFR